MAGEAEVELTGCHAKRFAGVSPAFQEVGLRNSSPRRSNRVCPDATLFEVTAVLDPVAKHLKDLDHRVLRVIKEMADAVVGAERAPIGIFGSGTFV